MIFRRFEALIDVFKPSTDVEPPSGIIAFYAHYLRQIWPLMIAVLVLGFFAAFIEVLLFSYLGRLTDMIQATPSREFFSKYQSELIWMLLLAMVIRPVVFGIHDLLMHQAINPGLTNMIRWQHHRYVLKQSLNFFQNDFAGRVAQRVLQTGQSLRESTMQVVDALWFIVVYTGSALYLFAAADPRLMIPLISWIVLYTALLCYFVPRLKNRSAAASEARSKLMGRVVDSYSNITTLKLFAHTQFEEKYAGEAMAELVHKFRLQARTITLMDFLITSLNGLLIVATGALALWLWSGDLISAGAIVLALGLVIRLNNMAEWIMWVVNGIFDNVGSVQDGMKTIAQPRQVVDEPDAKTLQLERGGIRFDNIHFHYGKERGVLSGLSLEVKPGEKIGLVGPSGAGKSTLVSLLLRLYDLQDGAILIDGQNIAEVTQDSLRAQIGMITQDTALLHRSIRENLLYGKPDASEEELLAAVRKASADSFIPLLDDG
jgi:ATP-binding cassette subfamily B multidrug efflux pump